MVGRGVTWFYCYGDKEEYLRKSAGSKSSLVQLLTDQINEMYEMLACKYTQNQNIRDTLSGIISRHMISRLLGFTSSF